MDQTEPKPRARRFPLLRWVLRHHLLGALVLVVFATFAIAAQVEGRDDFATSELALGVEERWGEPVWQPAPSVRSVQSGTVFTELKPVALDMQHVDVQAQMNYRKRGLRYFSGFDFSFAGQYRVQNREPNDIDVAFIFPIELNKSQVLLSELQFLVNGEQAPLDLGKEGNRLVWTGRIPEGEAATFAIRYRARGLESFVYRLDPSLPARDVRLKVAVEGGDNFDFPAGVLSASQSKVDRERIELEWSYGSLESGVNLGVILPSTRTFDAIIASMARRAFAPFLAFFLIVVALALRHHRPLHWYETYLLASAFGFFFVVLAYLAAFMNFYAAYAVSLLGIGAVVVSYLRRLFCKERRWVLAGLWGATMAVPTAAVVLEGYTGLIYTLELLAALLGLMFLSTRATVRAWLSDFNPDAATGTAS